MPSGEAKNGASTEGLQGGCLRGGAGIARGLIGQNGIEPYGTTPQQESWEQWSITKNNEYENNGMDIGFTQVKLEPIWRDGGSLRCGKYKES